MEKFKEEKKSKQVKRELPIIGNAPEEVKKMVKEKYREYIYGGENIIDMPRNKLEEIKSIECEKRSQEIELIKAANEELNRIMLKLGLKPFDVPVDNIHIFDSDLYEKKTKEGKISGGRAGFFVKEESFIGIPSNRRDNLFDFGAVVFHELNHLKGFKALKVDKIIAKVDDKKNENEIEKDKSILYLIKKYLGLEEKIPVESKEMTIGRIKELQDYLFSGVKSKLEKESGIKVSIYRSGLAAYVTSEKDERLTKILKNQGKNITVDDLVYAHFSGLEEAVVAKMEGKYCEKLLSNSIIKGDIQNKKIDETYIDMHRGYPVARTVLDMLIAGIYEKNKDKFESEEDVFNIFIKAHFTGQLLVVSRLVKNTFGKEVFDKVAKMGGYFGASEAEDAIKLVKLREKISA